MSGVPRRRVLALGGAVVAAFVGGVATALARVLGGDDGEGVAAGPPSSGSTSTTGASTSTTTSSTTTTTAAPVTPTGPVVSYICRDAWGARPATRRLPTHTIEHVTVHHTAAVLDDNAVAPSRMRGHQRFHQSREFADIAYHFVVDGRGHVYEGRAIDQPGESFTDYDTTGHLLVTVEGNFDEQLLPPQQHRSLVLMLAWASRQYGIPPSAIRGHRDVAATSCPGRHVQTLISSGALADEVEQQVVAGARAELFCGPDAERLVAEIAAGRV